MPPVSEAPSSPVPAAVLDQLPPISSLQRMGMQADLGAAESLAAERLLPALDAARAETAVLALLTALDMVFSHMHPDAQTRARFAAVHYLSTDLVPVPPAAGAA